MSFLYSKNIFENKKLTIDLANARDCGGLISIM